MVTSSSPIKSKVEIDKNKYDPFGDTYANNIHSAAKAEANVSNDMVIPKIGEGFVIVNLDWKVMLDGKQAASNKSQYAHHAACVIALTDSQIFTVETFTGTNGKNNYIINSYNRTNIGGKTFHRTWSTSKEFASVKTKTLLLKVK